MHGPDAGRIYRCAGRLVCHRSRPPALDRPGSDAHGRCHVPGDGDVHRHIPGTAFIIVYVFVFGAGSYYILSLIGKGPEEAEAAYGDHGVEKPPIVTELTLEKREINMFSFESFVDLPLIWYGLIATAIFLYVLLDGFDLGVGVLFPFAPTDQCRDRMMNSIAPFWDGNETWLVLGGGGLFAAFPLAYAVYDAGPLHPGDHYAAGSDLPGSRV